MIEINNLCKAFGERAVLQNIDLHIPDGSRLCIIGSSGSGKSVLVRCMLGLETMDAGEICIDEVPTSQLRRTGWRKILDQFGVVFQRSALFDSLSVRENVGIKLYENREHSVSEIEDRIVAALSRVHLKADILDRYPAQLSGGMQKRVAIARAIIHNPRYLIYDEPTTGLDPAGADRIDALIMELAEEVQRSTIVVTHDMDSLRKIATQVAMIYQTHLTFTGAPADFWISERPEIMAYLGRGR